MRRKRALAGLLCAALLCTLLVLPASGAEIYFTAINDNVSPLTADTMPVWSGGVLYVPYTVFDGNTNGGIRLGIYSSYSRSENTVTVFTTQQMLVFDLNNSTCYDYLTGATYQARAITRNGKVYLPVHVVCNLFGLSYSYNAIPYVSQGYLVRVKSAAVVLDDATFIDAAGNLINRRLREYRQALSPTVEPPTPTTPVTPPAQPDPEPVEPSETPVYLGFRCEDAAGLEDVIDALEGQDESAVFFFDADGLAANDDLVRRLLGSGHSVGLLAGGTSTAESLRALETGNALLERVAHTRAAVVLAPTEQRAALEERGFVCWNETLVQVPRDGDTPSAFSARVLRALSGRTRAAFLTLDGSAATGRALSTLLRRLEEKSFIVSIPLETRL